MCGRYANDVAIDDLMTTFNATPGTAYDWTERFSIAPSTKALIVREWYDGGQVQREVDYARWGLRPEDPLDAQVVEHLGDRVDSDGASVEGLADLPDAALGPEGAGGVVVGAVRYRVIGRLAGNLVRP